MTTAVTGHHSGTRGRASHKAEPAAAGALLTVRALAVKQLPIWEMMRAGAGGTVPYQEGGIHVAWPSDQQHGSHRVQWATHTTETVTQSQTPQVMCTPSYATTESSEPPSTEVSSFLWFSFFANSMISFLSKLMLRQAPFIITPTYEKSEEQDCRIWVRWKWNLNHTKISTKLTLSPPAAIHTAQAGAWDSAVKSNICWIL